MIRLSIGVENYHDILSDIDQALGKIPVRVESTREEKMLHLV
jgi:hypothetical protein